MFKIEIELKTNNLEEAQKILKEVINKIQTTAIYSASCPEYYYNIENTKLFQNATILKNSVEGLKAHIERERLNQIEYFNQLERLKDNLNDAIVSGNSHEIKAYLGIMEEANNNLVKSQSFVRGIQMAIGHI